MAKVNSKGKVKNHKMAFIIETAEAKEVFLVWNFNNFDPRKHPMEKNEQRYCLMSRSGVLLQLIQKRDHGQAV